MQREKWGFLIDYLEDNLEENFGGKVCLNTKGR